MKRKEIKAVAFTLALFVASFTVGCAASQVESTYYTAAMCGSIADIFTCFQHEIFVFHFLILKSTGTETIK